MSIDKFPWRSRDTMNCNEVHNFFFGFVLDLFVAACQRVLPPRGGLKFPDPDKTSPSVQLSPIPPSRPKERSLFLK